MSVAIQPGVDFNWGDPVTRQTLWDMWADGILASPTVSDLETATIEGSQILVGSTASAGPRPGEIWFDQTGQIWRCYFDEVDNTGVSLWCAIGPDLFEDAFLAAEPMPWGALFRLDPDRAGRWVKMCAWDDPGAIGFNQEQSTTASGSWFRGGVAGLMDAWFPYKPNASSGDTNSQAGTVASYPLVGCSWQRGAVCAANVATFYRAERPIFGACLTTEAVSTTMTNNGNMRYLVLHPGAVRQGMMA